MENRMYFEWIRWMIDTHNPNYELGCNKWGVNIETQLIFCEPFARLIGPDTPITQIDLESESWHI
jgi:hypothetical protein